jgi:hypothetical protein
VPSLALVAVALPVAQRTSIVAPDSAAPFAAVPLMLTEPVLGALLPSEPPPPQATRTAAVTAPRPERRKQLFFMAVRTPLLVC